MVRITTLIENSMSENKSLKSEHGLSFYIEMNNRKLLFDCGSGSSMIHNAQKLNVSLLDLEFVVISHSHYDHAGGFYDLIKSGCRAPLYIGPHFWDKKYAFDGNKYTYLGCGFNQDFLMEHNIPFCICSTKQELFKGAYLIGDFERIYNYEVIAKRFVKETEVGIVSDDFADEICLVLESEKGLIVIVGCSHPGILNMLDTVRKQFAQPIYAVFGGSHLVEGSKQQIEQTYLQMEQMGIKILGLDHCTGTEAIACFEKHHGEIIFSHLKSGDCYIV